MTSHSGERAPPRLHSVGSSPTEPDHHPCPRCNSGDTKFCYYNNYNLAQPRHFCKSCRRYWTRGGSLRNVPVGGGSRKNTTRKRPRTATSSADSVPVDPVGNKNDTESFSAGTMKENETGFVPFLNQSGFVPFLNQNGIGFGMGSSYMGFGVGEGGSGSGNTWQMGGVEEESFGWPDLTISSLGWGPKQ